MKERGSIIQLEGDVFGDKILIEPLPTNSAGRLLKVNFMIRIKLMSYLRRETHKRSRATHNGRVGGLNSNCETEANPGMLLRTNWCVRGEGAVPVVLGRSRHLSIHRRLNTRRGRINQG